jgi:hypothetical protein
MSSEQHRPEQKSDAGVPVATPAGERARREDEPVVTTPAVRVWEITLPPETEAALRTTRF